MVFVEQPRVKGSVKVYLPDVLLNKCIHYLVLQSACYFSCGKFPLGRCVLLLLFLTNRCRSIKEHLTAVGSIHLSFIVAIVLVITQNKNKSFLAISLTFFSPDNVFFPEANEERVDIINF